MKFSVGTETSMSLWGIGGLEIYGKQNSLYTGISYLHKPGSEFIHNTPFVLVCVQLLYQVMLSESVQ